MKNEIWWLVLGDKVLTENQVREITKIVHPEARVIEYKIFAGDDIGMRSKTEWVSKIEDN